MTTLHAEAVGKRTWPQYLGWGLFLVLLALAWKGAEMNPLALYRDSGNMATFAADFFPPDFHEWRSYLKEMIVTVQIALWGTVLAIVCSVPLGILCADNITPWWIHQPLRRVMDAFRSINEMVFASCSWWRSAWVRLPAFWPCGSAPPGSLPSCLPKRSRPSTQARWKGCALPVPVPCRK